MGNDFKGALSPDSEKLLDSKLKFKNTWAELGDGYLIKILDNKLLSKVIQKLDGETADLVKTVLAEVIEEMPEVEI